MTSFSRDLAEFLKTYRGLTCLWDPRDIHYTIRKKREMAIAILVEKYKPINGNANAKMVKVKIENMRYSYKRERKKVLESRRNASSPQDEYMPTLWYYPYMTFLNKVEDLRNLSDSHGGEETGHVTKQKQRLIDFLKTYKSLPELWDNEDELYKNKTAREQAYNLILKKYKAIDRNATVASMKLRIDNLRNSYGRERKKVLASGHEHVPSLWYYQHMTFLEKTNDTTFMRTIGGRQLAAENSYSQDASVDGNVETEEEFEVIDYLDDEIFDEDLTLNVQNPESDATVIEEIDFDESIQEEFLEEKYFDSISNEEKSENNETVVLSDLTNDEAGNDSGSNEGNSVNIDINSGPSDDTNDEAQMFGRTVGLSLIRLGGIQKELAKKLITDILYMGRWDRLKTKSFIQLREEPH